MRPFRPVSVVPFNGMALRLPTGIVNELRIAVAFDAQLAESLGFDGPVVMAGVSGEGEKGYGGSVSDTLMLRWA